jgi:DNA-binding CsgD family transcriptional regulator
MVGCMTSGPGREGVFLRTVEEAVDFVRQGLSVHVVGPHGSGRTELLGLVADRLEDDGWTILRLFGNPAWRQDPFAALVAAGVGASSGPANAPAAPGPRRTVGDMSAALAQQLRGGRVVVVVDDAEDLDLASVGALLAAHHQRRLVAVTASRPQLPVRPESLLLGLNPCVRLRPPVLDVDEVHATCRAILGGPVEVTTLARITTQSGGLAGLVRAIATIGRSTGALQLADGVWRAPGWLWTPHLGAAVEHYLAGAEGEVRDAATNLAVSGPVPLEEADRLVGRAMLDRLFSTGLVHSTEGVVGLFPPLLAEYLKREGSAFGLTDQALDLPPTVPPVTIGRAVGADAAVRNQRMVSRAASDVTRLQAIWQADPSPETAMPLLVAMRAAARTPAEIEYVVTATPARSSFADARMRSWHATWTAVDQGRLAQALELLDEASARMPDQRRFFEVTRAHVVFLRDRVPPAELLQDLRGTAEADDELLRVLDVELLLAAGRPQEASALLDGFHPTGRVATGQAMLLGSLAAVMSGDLDGGVARARRGYSQAVGSRNPGLQQAHTYTAVLGLGLAGRLLDAAQILFDALSAGTVASYRDVYHTGMLVLGSTIAIAQGRTEYATALAAQAQAAYSGRGPFPGMDPRVLRARLEESSLWPIVDDRLERGYLASAVFLAVDAAEVEPDPARGRQIRALGDAMEGTLLPALARYAGAAAAEEEASLVEAAEALAATGAVLYAVRAEVTRGLLLRRTGRAEQAADLVARAWENSTAAGLERAGLFTRMHRDVGLSARELEIVQLLALPMSTQDVARHLQMSVRTVETHVHNASRKLGVSGRDPLVHAVTTWL